MVSHLKWLAGICIATNIFFATITVAASKPQFLKQKIQLVQGKNKKNLIIEIAETNEQLSYGLMFRKKLAENDGMLFVFNDEQIRDFWMKNTLIDLDIAYFDKNKKITDVQQMKAVASIMQTNIPTYPSKYPAQYALEMNKGWFEKNNFSIGAELKILPGRLSKTK